MNFSRFQRPSRYIGSEFNSNARNEPVDVRMALAFPDVYEIGMSHLGTRILYSIINSLPYAAAERAFAPWTDLRDYMRRNGELLSSIETKRPLNIFDLVGFSLQHELCYTTVLDMIDLAGIPLRTEDRLMSSEPLPIIIAGGPSTVNPAPMSPFIDAFLVGDGEEAIVELLEKVRRMKSDGLRSRENMLRAISEIEGFYVPHIHDESVIIKRRFVADLDAAPFPEKQIVPYAAIVHDRVNVEIARGCPMGCRFCQAGIIYRPLRERSPKHLLRIARNLLADTGYDEISLTSLSSGDYSCLLPLIKEFNKPSSEHMTAVSLPSLRVGSVSRDVLKEIRSVRKTGFTMAPEAATDRLRRVINKDFTDEDYEAALTALFGEGWLTLKLYFMIGLPTEREEDITAINEMAMKALRIAKRNSGKFVNINITVSPFIPKPHTPFQWLGQISLDEMKRKMGFLRHAINSKKFKYKGHNENMSFLEAVFARGDEKLADLIEEAWRSGCVLDPWSECFDFNKWQTAMDKTGIDGAAYAERSFPLDSRLPWDNIDTGVSRAFLLSEYSRAMDEVMTPNCRQTCSECGLQCGHRIEAIAPCDIPAATFASEKTAPNGATAAEASGDNKTPAMLRVRCCFSKFGMLRYLSHRELMTAMARALKRAGIPVAYTKGFHPNPDVSFGPPLNVGIAGTSEYFDMEVTAPFDVQLYRTLLNSFMPDGLSVNQLSIIKASEPSLTGFVSRYEFLIACRECQKALPDASEPRPVDTDKPLIVMREGKETDISGCIESVEKLEAGDEMVEAIFGRKPAVAWRIILKETENVKVRLAEITQALLGCCMDDLEIIRTGMYGWKDGWRKPL
jgi:radical SAM family uncharacterized protein/radical SAM-linked protein